MPFLCHICGKSFQTKSNLNRHLNKKKKVQCINCGYSTERFDTLKRHFLKCGQKKTTPILSSSSPSASSSSSSSSSSRKRPAERWRAISKKKCQRYTCQKCGNIFSSRSELYIHQHLVSICKSFLHLIIFYCDFHFDFL